jgi:hypothetical protein
MPDEDERRSPWRTSSAVPGLTWRRMRNPPATMPRSWHLRDQRNITRAYIYRQDDGWWRIVVVGAPDPGDGSRRAHSVQSAKRAAENVITF